MYEYIFMYIYSQSYISIVQLETLELLAVNIRTWVVYELVQDSPYA